jgi:prepilin-type N-terminal cleavage/methylation domain-containing protein
MSFSKSNKAFTLTEVVVTIAIFCSIMIAVSAFQYNIISFNRSSTVSLSNVQESQSLMKIMAKELRAMETGSDGSYPIVSASTSSLIFFADNDGDGLKEKLRYFLATTTLYRGSIKPSGNPVTYNNANESIKVMITGIRNSTSTSIFEYYDGMYAGTTTAMTYPLTITSIRLIKLNLTVDSDPNKSPIPIIFSTQAVLRNLKDNL